MKLLVYLNIYLLKQLFKLKQVVELAVNSWHKVDYWKNVFIKESLIISIILSYKDIKMDFLDLLQNNLKNTMFKKWRWKTQINPPNSNGFACLNIYLLGSE